MAVTSAGRSLVTYLMATAMAVALVLGAWSEAKAETIVHTSGGQVDTWDPIFPGAADLMWGITTCVPVPAVGLGASWVNPHKATDFGPNAHPWQSGAGFTANWINAWSNLSSQGPSGQSWTKYSTQISGTGDFVLNLLADNCSWIYLDGTLVGFQDTNPQPRTYPVRLSGIHTLSFIIFDGGGLAGGMYRLETNTGTTFTDSDGDGLADVVETQLYGTDPLNPDTDGDGVSDGAEVAAGTDPLVPNGPVWSVSCGLPPIVKNGAGTGQFNAGSSIPVKCRITDGTNVITTATGTATISNGTTIFSQALKYDPTEQQYVAPVKTGKTAIGAYNVSVTITGVGTVAVATIQLR